MTTEHRPQDKACAECGRPLPYVGDFMGAAMHTDDSVPERPAFAAGAPVEPGLCFACSHPESKLPDGANECGAPADQPCAYGGLHQQCDLHRLSMSPELLPPTFDAVAFRVAKGMPVEQAAKEALAERFPEPTLPVGAQYRANDQLRRQLMETMDERDRLAAALRAYRDLLPDPVGVPHALFFEVEELLREVEGE